MWEYLSHFGLFAAVELVIVVLTIPWILTIKKDSSSAVAWCLIVILLPIIGFLLFVIFGYNHVYRPLKRKRRHRARYRAKHAAGARDSAAGDAGATWHDLGTLAWKLGAFPVSDGNRVTLYHESQQAFDDLFDAIRNAQEHIHVEYFIVQPDATGEQFLQLLAEKARSGVEVRLLFDAIGSFRLKHRMLRPLEEAGGKCSAFLTLNLLRRRIQVNMRNHRKIAVVDGRTAFIGGLNIGDEYLGKDSTFGYWRDAHMQVQGPAVSALQHIFVEDWDFAAEEPLKGANYFPHLEESGNAKLQVIDSGPDQAFNSLRELFFAAILSAREKLWIATPYFVPDASLLDALRLAGQRGVDVRILVPARPDHWLPYYAGRFYWSDVLSTGVKIYEYAKGMMHAKTMTVDGKWASIGSANLDNRSLYLNFETNCILHSPDLIAQLDAAFLNDLESSERVDFQRFSKRAFTSRLSENVCRLLAPVL